MQFALMPNWLTLALRATLLSILEHLPKLFIVLSHSIVGYYLLHYASFTTICCLDTKEDVRREEAFFLNEEINCPGDQ